MTWAKVDMEEFITDWDFSEGLFFSHIQWQKVKNVLFVYWKLPE